MIGGAHVSTVRDIQAARAAENAADGHRAPWTSDTPMLPLLGLSGPYSEAGFVLDWSRDAAGMED